MRFTRISRRRRSPSACKVHWARSLRALSVTKNKGDAQRKRKMANAEWATSAPLLSLTHFLH
jgi:hypothetical protein